MPVRTITEILISTVLFMSENNNTIVAVMIMMMVWILSAC